MIGSRTEWYLKEHWVGTKCRITSKYYETTRLQRNRVEIIEMQQAVPMFQAYTEVK